MTPPADKFAFTPWNATKFFVPLFLQAASQSLTYPLVGVVVAHGLHGPAEFSAFSQGFMIMFLIGTLGFGLITTGMVYAKDLLGYLRFQKVNTLVMILISAIQLLLALPLPARLVFGSLLGLEGVQLEIARWSMLLGLPAQLGFLVRNGAQVLLYNDHATGLANLATILRILLTALLAPAFYALGLVGWTWGCVCLTLPVFIESGAMIWFARAYARRLPRLLRDGERAPVAKIFLFNIPLSLGGTLLSLSVFMLARHPPRRHRPHQPALLRRAPQPGRRHRLPPARPLRPAHLPLRPLLRACPRRPPPPPHHPRRRPLVLLLHPKPRRDPRRARPPSPLVGHPLPRLPSPPRQRRRPRRLPPTPQRRPRRPSRLLRHPRLRPHRPLPLRRLRPPHGHHRPPLRLRGHLPHHSPRPCPCLD